MIGTPPPIPRTRLLAEIATLSKVNAVRMKVLVKQVVQYGLTGEIDYDKVRGDHKPIKITPPLRNNTWPHH